ncbi:HTH domain-containing protein [Ligilactobacillus ruminis]|uniref:HTH domain-containing protein n=1 Tax=Ligilactobacillus ruminis TaxID=1623 RepID=UPI00235EAE6E|nr:HTH domain-containing protein [Ligilactobacillus ruminis]WDC79656.1 HTH domain-containing protein [Ligilactobacillus ruminis]
METIEKVFNLLTETPEYVSGQQIANKLNISRTAVWKAVSSLKQRGFLIEGKTRMVYRYLPSMKLNEDEIRRYLDSALDLTFETYEQIESTNDFCKKLALDSKIVEFFSLPQDDFRSVEGLENAGNPHKLYVFARSRRFFYRLC